MFADPFSLKAGRRIDYYASWYTYPYFSQNWSLFVPAPDTNYKLFVEYDNNGKQITDVFGEILLKHQCNRLGGQGPLLLALANSIHYFEKNTELRQRLNGPVKNDLYFQIVENGALNYIRSTRDISPREIKMRLVVEDVKSGAEKVYFN